MNWKKQYQVKKATPRTLRSELLWILSVTSLVTMLLVGVILSFILFKQSFAQAEEDLGFYMESVQKQFTNHMSFIAETVIFIRNNPEWEDFFRGKIKNRELLEKSLEKGSNLFAESNILKGVYPIVKDLYIFNLNYDSIDSHFYPMSVAEQLNMSKRLRQMLREYVVAKDRFSYFAYGDTVELYVALYDDDLRLKGYCVALLSSTGIREIFYQLGKYQSDLWGILDSDYEVVLGEALSPSFLKSLKGTEGEARLEGTDYRYHIQPGNFGLTSYLMVPKSKLYQDIEPGFKMAWMIAASLFFMVLLVIFYISKQLSKPLLTIVQKMKQVGKGDFDTRLGNYNIQEFQEISRSFNDMTEKIDHLIKEVYEAEILVKEARIQYLQAQTNPHFMFNVLSMIAIRLKKNKDEDLYRMVTAFAGLMQGKLFRKNEIEILLADEMEIVEFYLYLSGERFKDKVSYQIFWESDDLKECMIPRLSVEPIVENAMIHGLEPKSSKGHITVRISQKDKKILQIEVKDDGVGFDMQSTLSGEERKSPGTGIMNIRRLIYNLYGDDYGVDVESNAEEGTTVLLRLPYSKEKQI